MKKSWMALAGVCVFSGLWAAPAAAPAPTVSVEPAIAMDTSSSKEYIGKIGALDEVDLYPRVTGVLLSQKFADGDVVKKGQLLFELEDTTYRAKADAARAVLMQNQADLEYAKSELYRKTTLRKQKAVAETAYEDAVRNNALAQAKVAAAQAALMEAENNLSYTKIYAPLDGRAGVSTFSEGNLMTPSTGSMLNITYDDQVDVDFPMSERDFLQMFGSFAELKKRADVRIVLADGSLYPQKGEIILIDNKVDTGTDTIRVRARFNNPEHKLLPNGLPIVRLARREEKKFAAVRPTALLFNKKGVYVYVLDDKNIAQMRPVTLGALINDWQTVTSGLKPGERVISDGVHKVRPDTPVNPVPVKEEK